MARRSSKVEYNGVPPASARVAAIGTCAKTAHKREDNAPVSSTHNPPLGRAAQVFDYIVDALFWLDLAVGARTSYRDAENELVLDPKQVRER